MENDKIKSKLIDVDILPKEITVNMTDESSDIVKMYRRCNIPVPGAVFLGMMESEQCEHGKMIYETMKMLCHLENNCPIVIAVYNEKEIESYKNQINKCAKIAGVNYNKNLLEFVKLKIEIQD